MILIKTNDLIECAFRSTVERNWYQLAITRRAILLETARDKKTLLTAHMEFLEAVILRNLQEDHADTTEFEESTTQFLTHLHHFRLADPDFVILITRQMEDRFR